MQNKTNILLCERCGRIIETKEELVVAYYLFTLSAFHNECYAAGLKSNIFLGSWPLNGAISDIATVLLSTLSIIAFFLIPTYQIKLTTEMMAIICLLLRIYIWLNFENKLD